MVMNNFNLADELDQAIEACLADESSCPEVLDVESEELLAIAAELRTLPNPQFKTELGTNLRQPQSQDSVRPHVVRIPSRANRDVQISETILPTLYGSGNDTYPIHQRSFAASVLVHVSALALVVASAVWAANQERLKPVVTSKLIMLSDYPLPPAANESHGGGGGGANDKPHASNGHPPRFSSEQLAPPTVVVRNPQPKLPVDPTVIGPPTVTFPQTGSMGDPLSAALIPSNGIGTGGGIGDTSGTGVGSGKGPGVGPGGPGGIGGGPYQVGGGVSAPHLIFDPEPQYSEEARRAKFQGSVVLSVVVGADGCPQNVQVRRSLGMGLDEKAIETVRTWRFAPAMKDGLPVSVQVSIEVNFRLF
jgi:protein TonB